MNKFALAGILLTASTLCLILAGDIGVAAVTAVTALACQAGALPRR